MTVRVHFHLHKKWLVIGVKTADGWRSAAYVADACLHDARFVISTAGQATTRRGNRRRFHAWVEGTLCPGRGCSRPRGARPVTYNPFREDTFMCAGAPIHAAAHVTFALTGCGRDRKPTTFVD